MHMFVGVGWRGGYLGLGILLYFDYYVEGVIY
jgi:hypothetical protein